jgi:hypothetical protein
VVRELRFLDAQQHKQAPRVANETPELDEHQVRPATTTTVSHRQTNERDPHTDRSCARHASLPSVRPERTARARALTAESHETKKVGLLRDLFCFSNGRGEGSGPCVLRGLGVGAPCPRSSRRVSVRARTQATPDRKTSVGLRCDPHASRLLPRSRFGSSALKQHSGVGGSELTLDACEGRAVEAKTSPTMARNMVTGARPRALTGRRVQTWRFGRVVSSIARSR